MLVILTEALRYVSMIEVYIKLHDPFSNSSLEQGDNIALLA